MKRHTLSSSASVLGMLALVGAACGGAGGASSEVFSSAWQNDQGRSIAAVEQRLRSVPRRKRTPIAVGVEANGLVGATLPSGKVWRARVTADSAPVIAGELVVVRSGKEIVALDARDGRVMWKRAASGRELGGAGDDGRVTVVSLVAEAGSDGKVVAIDRSGDTVFDLDTTVPVGRPAVLGGVAFIPWGGQYVSALDVETGDAIGRLLLRDLVSHALDFGTSLYFGERALVRFDEKISFAVSNQANRFDFSPRELPGKPGWLGSGIAPSTLDRTARTKIRSYALPEVRADRIGLANGAYAATYFRVVYGLAEGNGRLLFSDALPGDALGGAAAASGFVFCDASGKVSLYDARGNAGNVVDLGARLVGCSVEASGLEVAAGKARGSLPEQIERTLQDLDPDMATAENFLISELGRLEDPVVTRVLIALSQNVRIPAGERTLARALLAKRRNGTDYMLEALARHYDFISGDQPPPVGPLADALGSLRERRAAPLLARHLNDPANSIDDVSHAAVALEALATGAELGELKTFFALYRATADEPLLVRAVLSVGAALLRVGGPDGKALIERASTDPLTQPDVQKGLAELITPKPKPENATEVGPGPHRPTNDVKAEAPKAPATKTETP